jgi:hypothetical protein
MRLFNRYKKDKVLSWNQYSRLVQNIDHIRFIDQTAKESIRNYWKEQNWKE